MGEPEFEQIRCEYVGEEDYEEVVDGIGCRMKDVYIFLKKKFGDQFVGVF